MGSLKVIRAEYAGACYGVQRALDMTLEASKRGSSVCTLGPLIHNPRVVESLEAQGIGVAHSVDDIQAHDVVIRSHGVVPQVIKDIKERGFSVVDATCPHVMRAQRAAAKLARDGRYVLVVGEAGHPEVEGISAHAREAGGTCAIVGGASDIPDALPERVGVVVQTTQSQQKLSEVLEALEARGLDVEVKNTICSATVQRQASAINLARQVDAMVVIGGRNSSNTTRLYEICSQHCSRAFHIEDAEEIDPSWFEGCTTVGVSAGASTPEDQIDAVVAYLSEL
ncbi:MAG: 4-hydroxy-3-methylbut-2-enyl diphosphate reductase [Eggerthellaceae bacterium]